ncbi:hypothetical protein GCM10009716_33440 [Streptomyces sodiiphilus]|uniref:Uncharacterized protein n=1 Tax=Streptomyces sodiiphilus TaxID=226217 RepID=A0ABP5ATE6_9ACTN
MSRRAAKAGAAAVHDGTHRPGRECPWDHEERCSECVLEFAIHTAWQLTGKERPWDNDMKHVPEVCYPCREEE